MLEQIWKKRAPKNDEYPFQQSRKSWMWDQYLPENMKRKLSDETKKLRNFFSFQWKEFYFLGISNTNNI